MPVYSFNTPSATSFLLAWHIQEPLKDLLPQLPSLFLPDFYASSLRSTKRARQSVAVRLALACLLEKLKLPIVPLTKDIDGSPKLEHSGCYISFSHTTYLAIVALSKVMPIAIDLESVQCRLSSLQHKFLTPSERNHIANCLEKLTIAWCAKEALYKLLPRNPVTTFKSMTIAPFQLANEGVCITHCNHQKYFMHYKYIADRGEIPSHFIVWCEDKAMAN
ncbi:MAG: 4'-phosphopantetheinyl transferase superfamily protein [Amoebophilaceae bacterium]|nr:4'-phosphopantetheinyl transferase superfamily protein [Amoebophilaceae bacterium]